MRRVIVASRPNPAIILPLGWAGFVTLLVVGQWFGPGYIFGTDWPGPRHLDVPASVSSSTVLETFLAVLAKFLSAEVAGKLLIFGCLFFAALGAYRAVPVGGFFPRAAGAAIYVVNPFVYGRLHYGQMFVLAGYAALPWVAAATWRLLQAPASRSAIWLAAALIVLGVLDLHLLFPTALLILATAGVRTAMETNKSDYVRRIAPPLGLAALLFALASAYWMVPLLLGRGYEGQVIAHTGPAELVAYSVTDDPQLGLLVNVLGLYGFWAEDTGRFPSMKVFVPAWPIVLLALIALAVAGVVWVLRSTPSDERRPLRGWVVGLAVAFGVAAILEMGVASPVTEPLVRFLDTILPPYRGMRDAGKWAALIALVYSQVIPLGAVVVLIWLREHVKPPRIDLAEALAAGLLLALPLYYGNGLLFGMHGEVQPSDYPTGWYQADRLLAADPHPGRTLFLPWHLYLGLDFVRNTNNVVASPAPSFFNVPIVISQDPEVAGISPPNDPEQVAISRLVAAGATGDWASELASRNIKYVLLAREVDWTRYGFLASQSGFQLVADDGSIALYRNLLVR